MNKINIRHLTAKSLDKTHFILKTAIQYLYDLIKDGSCLAPSLNSLYKTSRNIDVKVSCPHCNNDMPLIDLELLKTYCFNCSLWGMDPRFAVDECEEEYFYRE